MTKLERLIIGVVINLILIAIFAVLLWRTQVESVPTSNQLALPPISLDLLKPTFTDRLKELEVNGSLPVTVVEDETQGEGRNPFE